MSSEKRDGETSWEEERRDGDAGTIRGLDLHHRREGGGPTAAARGAEPCRFYDCRERGGPALPPREGGPAPPLRGECGPAPPPQGECGPAPAATARGAFTRAITGEGMREEGACGWSDAT